MPGTPSNRRRFLQVVAHGSAIAGATSLGVACSGGGPSGSYAAGNVSAFPVGSLQAISAGPVAVGHDSGGLYAMSLICTHASCDMGLQGQVSSQGVFCSCHGSAFDVQGNPVSGPARSALEHYEVTVDATGAITVNADVPVAETTRTAIA